MAARGERDIILYLVRVKELPGSIQHVTGLPVSWLSLGNNVWVCLQRKGEFVLCGQTAGLLLLDAGGRKPPVSKLKRKASTNLLLLGSTLHTCHNSALCSQCCRMDHSETLKVEV